MMALTLWQPWASLIAVGAKRFETRSWKTAYRGRLLIHAAKGGLPQRELKLILSDPTFRNALGPAIHDLPFGAAVAVARLTSCIRTESMTEAIIGDDQPFGDFSVGRYAWRLEDVRAIEPLPMRGAQGLWTVWPKDARRLLERIKP